MRRRGSDLNREFAALWALATRTHPGLPQPVREFVFAKPRRWRWDFAWPAATAAFDAVGGQPLAFTVHVPLAVELDGGIWTGGAHGRGSGIQRNAEKRNAAVLLGWRILAYSATDLRRRPWGVVGEVMQALGCAPATKAYQSVRTTSPQNEPEPAA